MDSLSTGQSIQNDEDLVFTSIDRAVGRYPQESLGLPIDITTSKILPIMKNAALHDFFSKKIFLLTKL